MAREPENEHAVFFMGCVLGALLRSEFRQWLVDYCRESYAWLYVQRQRDLLTEVLVEAGREPPTGHPGTIEDLDREEK